MVNEKLVETIEDGEVRQFVRMNMDEMVGEVEMTLRAYELIPDADRAMVEDAGTSHALAVTNALVPDFNWDDVQKAIRKRVWNGLCEIDDEGQGKPDPDFANIFAEEGVGRTIIEMAVVAAFSAVGASLGGAAGAILAGATGGALRNLVTKFVSKILDQEVKEGLGKFCAVVPV